MVQDLLQGLRELTFPDNCLLCHSYLNSQHRQQLCSSCLSSITLNHPPFCLICSRHLTIFNEQGLCVSCLNTQHHLDVAWSACLYQEPLSELIHAFKYFGKTSLRKTFAQLMIQFIDTYHLPIHDFDIMIPMALHPARLRERGYNQAELLSLLIAQHYHLNHATNILKRSKNTQSQSMLDSKQRFTNVNEAFKIENSLRVADKNILIVDDLLTTTSTVNAASLALKNAGAAYVGILTLAMTP